MDMRSLWRTQRRRTESFPSLSVGSHLGIPSELADDGDQRETQQDVPQVAPEERPQASAKAAAFTFIEVLVVVVILSLLAGIVGTYVLGSSQQARADTTKIQIGALDAALGRYYVENGTFPGGDQGLEALLSKPGVGLVPENWQGPYLQGNSAPKDGWGNDFVYTSDGQDYTIVSLGADGVEGGSELNADISSKEL